MAKIEYGPMVSAASGSIAGTTFSRNRYGSYCRTKAIPVNPDTEYQQAVRTVLAELSQSWRGLTDPQRIMWRTWAQNNPFTDVLGNSQILQPNSAYVHLNALLVQAGDSVVASPPVADAPDALLTLSFVPSATLGSCLVTFTATPLADDDRMLIRAAVVNSAGITYVKNLYKLISITDKALATGVDIVTDLEERFGTMVIGQVVHVSLAVLDSATGLTSPPLTNSQVVV